MPLRRSLRTRWGCDCPSWMGSDVAVKKGMSMLTEEQKKKRLQGIGGSEISALVGLNPFAGPIDVWRSKCEGYEIPVTHHMERGTYLEDGVAKWYASRTGATLAETGTLTHPSFARVMCTPDRLATFSDGSRLDLSIKVPGPRAQDHWGTPGTDEVPEPYFVQVQWELLILEAHYGITRADIAAPIDGDLAVYHVSADRDTQQYLVEEANLFWTRYVQTRTPPPVDGSESSGEWLKARFPKHTRPMMVATSEAHDLMCELFEARTERKRHELREELATQRLKAILGDAEGMQGNGWKILFRANKDSVKVDWKAIAAEVGVPAHIQEKHTRPSQGPRKFIPSWEVEESKE